nr:hypothetical protein [Pandoravirus aubagnensis]
MGMAAQTYAALLLASLLFCVFLAGKKFGLRGSKKGEKGSPLGLWAIIVGELSKGAKESYKKVNVLSQKCLQPVVSSAWGFIKMPTADMSHSSYAYNFLADKTAGCRHFLGQHADFFMTFFCPF